MNSVEKALHLAGQVKEAISAFSEQMDEMSTEEKREVNDVYTMICGVVYTDEDGDIKKKKSVMITGGKAERATRMAEMFIDDIREKQEKHKNFEVIKISGKKALRALRTLVEEMEDEE